MYPNYMPTPYNAMYNPYNMYNGYIPYWPGNPTYGWAPPKPPIPLKDYGPQPYVVDIEQATVQNDTFRTALWTGNHLQLTLMSIGVGEDIGLEIHPDVDQFIRIEEGQGLTKMGSTPETLDFQAAVYDGYAVLIPAGTWHNLINTGYRPLKLYSIYAPPQHPSGTVHETKADAEKSEKEAARK
jgi:mannose-6-phosphate isomerase-like protein (cupin superfamily)